MESTVVPYTSCVICGCRELEVLFTRDEMAAQQAYLSPFFRSTFRAQTPEHIFKDHIYTTHCYPTRLVRCTMCGHISRDPRFSPESVYDEYQNDQYDQEWMELAYAEYRESFEAEMPPLAKMLGHSARVLEIGSQLGGFLSVARDYGWDAQGVDIGVCLTNFAKGKGVPVFLGSLFDAHFPDSTFDAVFVWLCFEMFSNPSEELAEIQRILKPGGLLVIDVPNADYQLMVSRLLHARLFTGGARLLRRQMAYEHVLAFNLQFGYSARSAKMLLSTCGFHRIQVRNQFYWPITFPQHVRKWSMVERALHINLVNIASEAVYRLSGSRLVLAPWILGLGYKE